MSTSNVGQAGSWYPAALMRGQAIHDGDRAAFYRASLHALRFCDARKPRRQRFGRDADAIWGGFAGDMGASERLDLLLRDADVEWPRAFAPRVVFDLGGLADDEPFGAAWAGLEAPLGEELWETVGWQPPAPDVDVLVVSLARAWGRELESVTIPDLSPTTRLIVAGGSAIASTICAFARGSSLAWGEQVLVVASQPFERHLAAMASPILAADHPTQLMRPREQPGSPFGRAALVISKDADDDARSWATLLRGEG